MYTSRACLWIIPEISFDGLPFDREILLLIQGLFHSFASPGLISAAPPGLQIVPTLA
jgi:hypothetical protein